MNRVIFILTILIITISCNQSGSQSKSNNVNVDTNNSNTQVSSTKFMVAVIYHKRGKYVISSSDNKTGFEGPILDYIYYSEIVETTDYDETAKYKILDQLETELRNKFGYTVHSISKRECKVFDTYIGASDFRRSLTD